MFNSSCLQKNIWVGRKLHEPVTNTTLLPKRNSLLVTFDYDVYFLNVRNVSSIAVTGFSLCDTF